MVEGIGEMNSARIENCSDEIRQIDKEKGRSRQIEKERESPNLFKADSKGYFKIAHERNDRERRKGIDLRVRSNKLFNKKNNKRRDDGNAITETQWLCPRETGPKLEEYLQLGTTVSTAAAAGDSGKDGVVKESRR